MFYDDYTAIYYVFREMLYTYFDILISILMYNIIIIYH